MSALQGGSLAPHHTSTLCSLSFIHSTPLTSSLSSLPPLLLQNPWKPKPCSVLCSIPSAFRSTGQRGGAHYPVMTKEINKSLGQNIAEAAWILSTRAYHSLAIWAHTPSVGRTREHKGGNPGHLRGLSAHRGEGLDLPNGCKSLMQVKRNGWRTPKSNIPPCPPASATRAEYRQGNSKESWNLTKGVLVK